MRKRKPKDWLIEYFNDSDETWEKWRPGACRFSSIIKAIKRMKGIVGARRIGYLAPCRFRNTKTGEIIPGDAIFPDYPHIPDANFLSESEVLHRYSAADAKIASLFHVEFPP